MAENSPDYPPIPEQLRVIRFRKGVTDVELAHLLRTTTDRVRAWASGEQPPRASRDAILYQYLLVTFEKTRDEDRFTAQVLELAKVMPENELRFMQKALEHLAERKQEGQSPDDAVEEAIRGAASELGGPDRPA